MSLVVAPLVLTLFGLLALPAGASRSHQIASSSTLTLTAQTPWVHEPLVKPVTESIGIDVSSPLPTASLALSFRLYQALEDRTEFDTVANNVTLPDVSCLSQTPLLPLGTLVGPSTNGAVSFRLRVADAPTSAPCKKAATLSLQCGSPPCDGVYPLVVSLVDRANPRPALSSFTTFVVVEPSGALALNVGIVIPFGTTPSVSPSGTSTLSASAIADIGAEARALNRGHVPVTLDVYPNLYYGLERSQDSRPATRTLGALDNLIGKAQPNSTVELLSAPFAPLDAQALAASGLASDVSSSLQRGSQAFLAHYGRSVPPGPYVSLSPLGTAGLNALTAACISELVVPEASAPTAIASNGGSPSAPFLVGKPSSCKGQVKTAPVAFVADAQLGQDLSYSGPSTPGGPVLAAERFLSELAQVFFELPGASPRAVVVVPDVETLDPTFLSTVLTGLSSTTILKPATLASLYGAVPEGLNTMAASAPLTGTSGDTHTTTHSVAATRRVIGALNATEVVPQGGLIRRLDDDVLLGESYGISASTRASYFAAPMGALNALSDELTIENPRTFTLTTTSGKVPLTFQWSTSGGGRLNVELRLQSSELELHVPTSQRFGLSPPATPYPKGGVSVTTRSPASILQVSLFTATGGYELLNRSLTVRSTAISGVAVVISIVALIVLGAWWLRVIRRKRSSRQRVDEGTPTLATPDN